MAVNSLRSQHQCYCTNTRSMLAALLLVLAGLSGSVSASIRISDQNSPLAIIQAYAQSNTNPAPTLADYTTLGIACVGADNLAVVNTAVDAITQTEVSSVQDVQTLVDQLLEAAVDDAVAQVQIIAYAENNTSPMPTVRDYAAIGATGVTPENLPQVNASIDDLTGSEVGTTYAVQTQIDGVMAQLNLIAYAEDNTNPAPTVDDYRAIGVSGVTSTNLAAVNQAIDTLAGDDVDTTLKIQTLIDSLSIPVLNLQMRGLLQGAYQPATGWMSDTLRTLNLIPASQPYQGLPFDYHGTETLDSALLTTTGSDAIVDWVLIELRDQHSHATLIRTQAALLQRDGDVVDPLTASSTIQFKNIPAGNYFVALHHRNHLPVMTQTAIALSEQTTRVDFTNTKAQLYGTLPALVNGDVMLLWVGDVNADRAIITNGPGNDASVVLSKVLIDEGNFAFNTNYQYQGYHQTDLNMDGITRFSGPNNDTNLLVSNILLHPSNTSYSANYIIHGDLP